LKPSARLLVIERLLGEANHAPEAKFSDLAMILLTGGRERAASEFEAPFSTAGFRLEQMIPTRSPFSIIVGNPSWCLVVARTHRSLRCSGSQPSEVLETC
jgi:O-methyltransferase